jgi:predicted PurR-regulated permease PerM
MPQVRSPTDGLGLAVTVLAVLAVIFTLHWARAVVIPITLGLLVSYALAPAVALLHSWHIPRALGAATLLLSLVGAIGFGGYSLSDDAGQLIETFPEAAQNFRRALNRDTGPEPGAIEHMQKAATELERAARDSGVVTKGAPDRRVTVVQIDEPPFDLQAYLWAGTVGALGVASQALIVVFLVYFMLAAGPIFRQKLVRIAGPSLSKRRVTVEVLNEINSQIQRYLLVQIASSFIVGIATWIAFFWLGVENAAIWGILAGVFNMIPYLGPVIVTGGAALVAFLQFGNLEMPLLVAAVSLVITSIEGYFILPWLTGRASRMNPVVVFVSIVFWGWLWGVWGLLLGVPIVMALKAICDRVEDLKPVAELLSD